MVAGCHTACRTSRCRHRLLSALHMTAFDYRTFLAIADELGRRADQAARRTALGRAYYAILGVAYRSLPQHEQARIGPGQIHDLTWVLYSAATAQSSRRVGGIGYRLRTVRRRADYRADQLFRSGYDACPERGASGRGPSRPARLPAIACCAGRTTTVRSGHHACPTFSTGSASPSRTGAASSTSRTSTARKPSLG